MNHFLFRFRCPCYDENHHKCSSKIKNTCNDYYFRGDLVQPQIDEFRVGPLPNPSSHVKILNKNYKDPIPYYMRSTMADHELRMWETYMRQELNKIDSFLRESTDG